MTVTITTFQSQLNDIMAYWAGIRGNGWKVSDGTQLPILRPGDSIVLLTPLTAGVRSYVQSHNQYGAQIPETSLVGIDGTFDVASTSDMVSLDDWLLRGVATPGNPSSRTMHADIGGFQLVGTEHEPSWVYGHNFAGPIVMSEWQNAVDVCSDLLSRNELATLNEADANKLYHALDDLASYLDVCNEVPALTEWQATKQAAGKAAGYTLDWSEQQLHDAAALAGKAAAEAGKEIGNVGGSFLNSFLSSAGITALAVTAGAIYIAIHFA